MRRGVVQKDEREHRRVRQDWWGAASNCVRCRRRRRQIAEGAWAGRGAVRWGANCRGWCRELVHGCRRAEGRGCQWGEVSVRERPDVLWWRPGPLLRDGGLAVYLGLERWDE